MEFRILGPVTAEVAGAQVELDGSKQRTVLAAMLLADGRVVSDERLTQLLWGWEPPATSTNQLYTYVSRLRTRIGPGLSLVRVGPGYRMDIGDAAFDWTAFQRLADRGRADLAAGRHADAERHLESALSLYRGAVLTGVTPHLAETEAAGLEEARLAALENRVEASLALGRHAEAVPELTRLVAQHPLREPLRCQLMTALYRCDRQADALAAYEAGRRALDEELGVTPGPVLRAVHQQVLTGELPPPAAAPAARPADSAPKAAPAARLVAAAPAAVPTGSGTGPAPAMLPADAADFTGRAAELDALRAALHAPGGPLVVTGAPGTGKSTLAVHAAHACRADFPDGQLYADLRAADGTPREPGDVLGWFLTALGAERAALPETVDERAQLYRTLLADRRVLVLLDNASDDARVRPLLPGGGASRALVTGERQLVSLPGAAPVRLGPLAEADAVDLLAAVAGRERVAADPESAARVAELCDRLPLALRAAGARLAAQPHWTPARLAARLAPEGRRLAELRFGSLDMGAALSAGHARLPLRTRTAFHLLAQLELPHLAPAQVVEWGVGKDVDDAEEILDELADAWLLETDSTGKGDRLLYRFSGLNRVFARGCTVRIVKEAYETPEFAAA
ncbi:BTAD domain-containing putative transcriptional regulator [Streptomyces sp. NPDC050504]|uniref:AfsR/SARP family transcriptional regulator n=1 Tax=Streptomyces sp. NPDC050504 TaxID=3365618 RepID=UPI00379D2F98